MVLKENSDIFPSIMAAIPVIATGPEGALNTAWINAIGIEKVHHVL